MPTNEEQKNLEAIGEYFTEYWGKGNAAIVDKLCADNFVINYPMHGPRYGKENAKKMLLELFPTFLSTLTNTLKDGLIVDETGEEGALTALQQLGLVQQPNAGKEVKYLHE
ncbi:Ff.00g006550.m01.CDS01 [Fusarium sp. VM40]|nr:Ff.00g006550.m01.CDS01 [Fusarium sp. VM40]